MAQLVYATVDDYVVYTGVMAPMEIPPRVMARASAAIDTALIGAVYDVDSTGLPTDVGVLAAVRDATCAQARPMLECAGKEHDKTAGEGCHLTAEAFDILRAAGLLPVYARMWG